tara:strand:- start:496 stop:660 length:165 start_codon:yes stop_codon:yes gene_type:complete
MKAAFLFGILLLALAIAGTEDAAEQQAQLDTYCQLVSDGVWPNYDPTTNCEESK